VSGESTVAIGLLLPDVLGTYSDAGNATVLAQRLRWRGIAAEIRTITARDVPPTSCAIYLVGGGEDTAQLFAADWLRRHVQLRRALETSAVTLAVCAGLQNHRGVTTLGPDIPPLGRVVTGTGNGTSDGTTRYRGEGVLTERIIGTYLHGPVLARNPALADHILHQATGQVMSPLELPDQAALRQTYLRGHAVSG
jgi:CobQ-like glutamine amidotransferase family enzyme